MSFSPKPRNRRAGGAALVLAALGMAYPFVVHAAMGRVPAGALVLLALALAGARFAMLRGGEVARVLAGPLAAVFAATGALALVEARVAALAYPVLMNLGFAAAFGWSVVRPPSLVQIFASVVEPDPSERARRYMRKVSLVWCLFLSVNASVALALALWADTALWALYTGLISYLLMGLLFAVEWLVRRRVRAAERGLA
jgi:uncharacterized membrane protein